MTINNSIKQLKEHFITNKVQTISEGVQSLNNLFNSESLIWSLEKEEWNKMNRKEKSSFVKTLLSMEILEENDDLNDDKLEVDIQQQFINYYLIEKDWLMNRMNEVNEQLKQRGHNVVTESKTKMDICKEWKLNNPTGTRKDFFRDNKELGSVAMLSTYYQKIK